MDCVKLFIFTHRKNNNMKTHELDTIKYFFEKFLKEYDNKKNDQDYHQILKQIVLYIDAYLIYSLVREKS